MFNKLFQAIGAQFGKFARWIWRSDPVAVLTHKLDQKKTDLNRARARLAEVKARVAQAERNRDGAFKDVADTERLLDASLRAGDRDQAGLYAQRREDAMLRAQNLDIDVRTLGREYTEARNALQNAMIEWQRLGEDVRHAEARLGAGRARREANALVNSIENDITSDFAEARRALEDQIDLLRAQDDVDRDMARVQRPTESVARQLREDALSRYQGARASTALPPPQDGEKASSAVPLFDFTDQRCGVTIARDHET